MLTSLLDPVYPRIQVDEKSLLHSRNARRLQRQSPFAPIALFPPRRRDASLSREVRFALRFARNGATGCQERVLACHILQSEMARPTSMN